MHDSSHEERILLGAPDAAADSCPGCREFRAALQTACDCAARAALKPPAWLDARVLGRQAPRPRRSWLVPSLVSAVAAAALLVLPSLREQPNLNWRNGIEKDLARMDAELAGISKEVAVQAEAEEFYQDLDHLEAMTKRLRKQEL
ncbi:MAG: hypothetical protein PHU21_00460 [Elusimicrobia bacterium]|nr:hypothetical protein [Elusimicrobiota bacterium]